MCPQVHSCGFWDVAPSHPILHIDDSLAQHRPITAPLAAVRQPAAAPESTPVNTPRKALSDPDAAAAIAASVPSTPRVMEDLVEILSLTGGPSSPKMPPLTPPVPRNVAAAAAAAAAGAPTAGARGCRKDRVRFGASVKYHIPVVPAVRPLCTACLHSRHQRLHGGQGVCLIHV